MDLTAILVIAGVLAIVLTGTPIWVAFAIGGAFVVLYGMGVPFATMAQYAFSSFDSYPLLAVPFFILSGALLVNSGGMSALRLVVAGSVSKYQGGLPILVIVIAALLGAVSGSSVACIAILAAVMLPLFKNSGLSREYGAGVIVVAAELGLIIPPSIYLILFGAANQISIADLFSGGLAAGLLLTACMAPVAIWTSRRMARQLPSLPEGAMAPPQSTIPATGEDAEEKASLLSVVPLLLFPVLILGSIYGGIISPTESASVAVFYSLALGTLVYRKLTWQGFINSLIETARLTALVYLLLFGADMLSRLFIYYGIPGSITSLVLQLDLGPTAFMFVTALFLLVLGFFFASLPMVVVVLPLFVPTVKSLGIDPVYFGIIGVVCATIGGLTPPFGPQLWIAEPLCNVPMGRILKNAIPFLLAWVVGLLIMLVFPAVIEAPVAFLG